MVEANDGGKRPARAFEKSDERRFNILMAKASKFSGRYLALLKMFPVSNQCFR
jgi:hypothetical protein